MPVGRASNLHVSKRYERHGDDVPVLPTKQRSLAWQGFVGLKEQMGIEICTPNYFANDSAGHS
jgi:hypothetical protein